MIIINKINILRIILIILLIVQFGTIFKFSNQDGKKSGSLSREITIIITKDVKSIQSLEKSKKEIVLKKIEHIIRKIAHFSLYALVGILTMSLMSTYNVKQIKRISVSLGISVIYAILDEIHQSFVPERTPKVSDVLIDGSGAVLGILIVIIAIKLWKYINRNSNSRNIFSKRKNYFAKEK